MLIGVNPLYYQLFPLFFSSEIFPFFQANNNQKLTKTKMDGTPVWQTLGNFGQDPKLPYRPTWFATPPNSNFTYMCDGCKDPSHVLFLSRHRSVSQPPRSRPTFAAFLTAVSPSQQPPR